MERIRCENMETHPHTLTQSPSPPITQIQYIYLLCPRPSIALTGQNRGLKTPFISHILASNHTKQGFNQTATMLSDSLGSLQTADISVLLADNNKLF